jgi:hypothetical protein
MKVSVGKECKVEVVVEAIGSVVGGGKSRWLRGAPVVHRRGGSAVGRLVCLLS